MVSESIMSNYSCLRNIPMKFQSNNDLYGVLLLIFGIISCCGNAWVVVTGALRWIGLRTPHKLLVYSCFSVLIYSTTTFISVPSMFANRLAWQFSQGIYVCWIYAYLCHVSFTMEMQSLALQTVVVYYKIRTVSIRICTYVLAVSFIWISSLVWGVLPFNYIGKYGCQEGEVVCSLQWSIENPQQKWYNIAYALVGVSIPSAIMIIYLMKLGIGRPENKLLSGYRNAMLIHGCGVLISRLLNAFIATWVMVDGAHRHPLPRELSKMATVQHQISCFFGVAAWIWCDDELRRLLLGGREAYRKTKQ